MQTFALLRAALSDIAHWLHLMVRHSFAFFSGIYISAIVSIIEHFTGKGIPWPWIEALIFAGFMTSAFLVWREERNKPLAKPAPPEGSAVKHTILELYVQGRDIYDKMFDVEISDEAIDAIILEGDAWYNATCAWISVRMGTAALAMFKDRNARIMHYYSIIGEHSPEHIKKRARFLDALKPRLDNLITMASTKLYDKNE